MNIFFPCVDTQRQPTTYELLMEVLEGEHIPSSTVSLVNYNSGLDFKGPTAAIFYVEDEESYWHSLNFLEQLNLSSEFRFMYIANAKGEYSWDLVHQFKPECFLLFPASKATIKEYLHSFVLRIYQQSYFMDKTSPLSGKLWLTIKRGVYQSIEINTIKYIFAEDHYIKIYCEHEALPLIKTTLSGFFEQHLATKGIFYLLNRSCIINLSKVKKIESNQLYIDERPLSIPKGKLEDVLRRVGV